MTASNAAPRTRLVWTAVLVVALAAATATAHGLYEVAHAAGAPAPIAALYPLITDGLALVAYATTTQLDEVGRRYAWTIVVLAAGLSGLAQAAYLADGVTTVPAGLRFGIGAWPAIAAAIAAHLLHLLATAERPAPSSEVSNPYNAASNPYNAPYSDPYNPYSRTTPPLYSAEHPVGTPYNEALDGPDGEPAAAASPARDRARDAARAHLARHGALPTVTDLVAAADVARGTAAAALRDLRDTPNPLRAVPDDSRNENDR